MRLQTVGLTFSALLFTNLSLSEVQAASYPERAFKASYTLSGLGGMSAMKMMSDGKGKMRTETTTGQGAVVSIMDYNARTMTTVMDAQKMVMKTKMPPDQTGSYDDDWMTKLKAKSLGTKVVLGHPCKGWKYTQGGADTEVWVGNDINYCVKSITKTPSGSQTMELKEFSNSAPDASVFVVPAGYKVMQLGK